MRNKAGVLPAMMLIAFAVYASSSQHSAKDRPKLEQASKAADHVIKRFRETLDFGVVFDETASQQALQLLHRGSKLFSFDKVDFRFLQASDGKTKERLFKVEMNFYYIKGAYDAAFIENLGDEEKERIPLPPDVKAFAEKSRFVKVLLEESTPEDTPRIDTTEELNQYLAEVEHITLLLRKQLPRDYFKTETYKKTLQEMNKSRKPGIEVLQGHQDLGISNETEVFVVTCDLFTIYFVEDAGQMKALAYGVGN